MHDRSRLVPGRRFDDGEVKHVLGKLAQLLRLLGKTDLEGARSRPTPWPAFQIPEQCGLMQSAKQNGRMRAERSVSNGGQAQLAVGNGHGDGIRLISPAGQR